MFRFLIALSLRHSRSVIILAGILLAATGWLMPKMPIDVFPELNAPTVVIMTEAGGLAADEVEQQVSLPIEASINGVTGLRRLRSASSLGLSIVWAEFDWGEDLWKARQLVSERLNLARERLPPQAHAEVAPVTSLTGEVMLVSVRAAPGSPLTPQELRAFAEGELTTRLLGVSGVAQVVAIGGELPEIQVLARQEALRRHGVSLEELAAATTSAHSNASAGFLRNVEGKELPLRHSLRVQGPEDVAATVLHHKNGRSLSIGDVAEVRYGAAMARGGASQAGLPAVIVSVQKAPGANTLVLDDKLRQSVASMPHPAGMIVDPLVFRQADFINLAIGNLTKVLWEAALIVTIILVLFLLNVRTALITLTALPLSLAVALLVFHFLGLTLNVMTIGGLAVALGGLVDDAIIDVENVFRRLRERKPEDSVRDVVEAASNEIRSPMVFATVIIVLVFLPLLFLTGMEGRFFQPLGIAYIASTLASLLVAVTVTPALCYLLLRHLPAGLHGEGPLLRLLHRLHGPALNWCLHHKRSVTLGSLGLAAACLGLASTFGSSFLPSFKESSWQVMLMTPPGTSLEESERVARGIEDRLAQIPGVVTVARRTGRGERDQHAEPPSSTEMNITLEKGRQEEVRRGIDAVLASVPGVVTAVGQPIEHRLSHVLSGTPAALAIVFYGEDLEALRAIAQESEGLLKALPGTRDVVANREVLAPSLPLVFRPADLARAGLTPAAAASQVELALAGRLAAVLPRGLRTLDLRVKLHPDEVRTPEQVRRLVIHGGDGRSYELAELADIGEELSSNLIAREGGRRKAVVSLNVGDGHNLGDLVTEVRKVIDPLAKSRGLAVHYGGQFEAQQEASHSLAWMGVGVLLLVFLLVAGALDSPRAALIVLLNLPLALIGGIVAVFLSESPSVLGNLQALVSGSGYIAPVLSIASLVGFITLFGIAVRNGILLVSRFLEAMRGGAVLEHAVRQGCRERLAAILMTALSAALGLIPLALMAGEPGAEILAPLAIVCLGGLLSSTLLNLLVVPAAFAWLWRAESPKN